MSADDNARVDAIEQALLARWPETRISPTLDRIAALTDILGSPQLMNHYEEILVNRRNYVDGSVA